MAEERTPRHSTLHLRIGKSKLERATRQEGVFSCDVFSPCAVPILYGFDNRPVVFVSNLQDFRSRRQL